MTHLYLSEKERKERLLQGIQPTIRLKVRLRAKKSDGMALTWTTQENVIRKTYDKRFAITLDFDFFKHPVYPYSLKEELTITTELNSAKEMIPYTKVTSIHYQALSKKTLSGRLT